MTAPQVQRTLLFLSKTTYDKRTTENSLLKENLFNVNSSTPEVEMQKNDAFKIYDAPAIMDTDAEAAEVEKIIKLHRKKSIQYNAVVLVFRYPVRMTPEEKKSIKIIVDVIGEKYIKKYGIMIFTNGISFLQEEDPQKAFEKYIQDEIEASKQSNNKQKYHCFGELIELITPERCMFINNEERDEEKRDEKREDFKGILDQIGRNQTDWKFCAIL